MTAADKCTASTRCRRPTGGMPSHMCKAPCTRFTRPVFMLVIRGTISLPNAVVRGTESGIVTNSDHRDGSRSSHNSTSLAFRGIHRHHNLRSKHRLSPEGSRRPPPMLPQGHRILRRISHHSCLFPLPPRMSNPIRMVSNPSHRLSMSPRSSRSPAPQRATAWVAFPTTQADR